MSMKVAYDGRIRGVNKFPQSMAELRTVVSRKFTERTLIEEQEDNDQSTATKYGKRRHLIDWDATVLFYEDSEGDLNVISEDDDLRDAQVYAMQKLPKAIQCSIVDKSMYKQFREEQSQSMLNQSQSWMQHDSFRLKNAKKANKTKSEIPKKLQKEARRIAESYLLEASKNFDLSTSQMINQPPQQQNVLQPPPQNILQPLQQQQEESQLATSVDMSVAGQLKFKSKMACVDQHTQMLKTAPGERHKIVIKVTNRYKHAWPLAPVIVNETTNETRPVQQILQPDETAEICYDLQIPAKVNDRTFFYRLQFANPMTYEKFGDSITLVCECEAKKQKWRKQPKFEKSDSYKEKIDGLTDVSKMAQVGLNMIDNVLQSQVMETQSDQDDLSAGNLSDIDPVAGASLADDSYLLANKELLRQMSASKQ